MKRGLIFTISIILLALSVIALARLSFEHSLREKSDEAELSGVRKSAYVFDDISDDFGGPFGGLFGFRANIIELNETHWRIILSGNTPASGEGALSDVSNISDYAYFIENIYANQTHANISLNLSAPDSNCVNFSNGMQYCEEAGGEFNRSTFFKFELLNYSDEEINVTCEQTAASINPMKADPNGDLNIAINYWDPGNSFYENILINSSSANKLSIQYDQPEGGKLEIWSGSLPGGESGMLLRTREKIYCHFTMAVSVQKLSPEEQLSYSYNIPLTYSQYSVSKSGMVEGGMR